MNLSFELLSKDNLGEAVEVLGKIFPGDFNQARQDYTVFLDKNDPTWKEERYWEYFVARDFSGKIVALTGLYNTLNHSLDEVWCGWYGVLPEFRGRGIGREVLKWTMSKAKKLGYKKFRLWTTNSPEEAEAQKLYESVGLKVYKKEQYLDTEFEKLYREINL